MTAQVHEELILNCKKMRMACCPPLPQADPRIITPSPEDRKDEEDIIFTTACWRNYIGTWKIKGRKLYLVRLRGRYKIANNRPIFAEWVDHELIIPQGKMLKYVHLGFESKYEKEIRIKIKKGIVIERYTIDNRTIDNRPNIWDSLRKLLHLR
jgi:hypothetical protein